jgi:hypothetical protein
MNFTMSGIPRAGKFAIARFGEREEIVNLRIGWKGVLLFIYRVGGVSLSVLSEGREKVFYCYMLQRR